MPTRRPVSRLLWALGATSAMTLVLVGTIGAVTFLHQRAAAETDLEPTPPLPVSVVAAHIENGFDVLQEYAGRLEPARETRLSFERAGLVVEVLVEQGDLVERGDLIAKLDVAPLAAQRKRLLASRRELEARLALARATKKRRSQLQGRGFDSDQSYDEARYDAQSLESQIEGVAAEIEALDIDLGKSSLRAPYSGAIAERQLDEGAVVSAGAVVALLQEVGRPQARVGVPPRVAAGLSTGHRYALEIGGRQTTATLVAVRPDLDTAARTVVALFDVVSDKSLPPMGEVVRLGVSKRIHAPGAWLPLSALKEGDEGLWNVLTVVDDERGASGGNANNGPTVRQEAVELVHVAGENAYVRGTLASGARVISAGVNRIVHGQRVTIAEAVVAMR